MIAGNKFSIEFPSSRTQMNRLREDRLAAVCVEKSQDSLGLNSSTPISIRLLREHSEVADGTLIYFINNKFVLHLSPDLFPNVAKEEAEAMRLAKVRLGKSLGGVILPISASGEVEGRSFIIVPLCREVSNNRVIGRAQRFLLRPKILKWLREVVKSSAIPSTVSTLSYQNSFYNIYNHPGASSRLKQAAKNGLNLLESGFMPNFTPMHGDLWRGNIFTGKKNHFKVIDWRSSKMDGYGIYDLIRFSGSYGVPLRVLRHELQVHQSILKAPPEVILVASLGDLLGRLGEFPLQRFLSMSESCFFLHDQALGL